MKKLFTLMAAVAAMISCSNNVENVPCTIELGTRKDAYRMIELKGFANSLNTIHGLILEMNHMFET